MVLRSRGRGRVGRRRHLIKTPPHIAVAFCFPPMTAPLPPSPQRQIPSTMTRAGIVTVAGKPNAGKSTLLNRLVGEKLSIISPKPQSTRDRVVGIRTRDDV